MSGSPMRRVALRNLAAHKVRLALTLLSVILGTAFIAGSFVFTDTLQRTFDGIFAEQAKGVDVRVSPKERQSLGVPLSAVQVVSGVEGVRAVAPGVNGPVVLVKDGRAVQTGGAPSWGQSYLPPERAIAEPQKFTAGAAPVRPGEIAINTSGAKRAGLRVGDKVKVLIPSRSTYDVTVTGIYEAPSDTGGFIGVLFSDQQARELFADGHHVAYVDVAAAPGVAVGALRDRIAKALPDFKVQNGAQVREDMKAQVGNALKFVNYFLLAFGAIALLVGTFIIYNTFSMIVAQRLRELALLRAVGASRRQVGLSVVSEALVVGLLGSAVGLAAGVALAFGLSGLLNAFDLGLPTGAMSVRPRTVLVALGMGVLVTVLSAYAPARRAARIPPVEAMREEFASVGESLRVRTIVGAVLAVAGVVLAVLGAQSTGGDAARTVGIGAGALILAVLLVSPWLSRPVVGTLGVPVAALGPIGRMARNNAVRNPRRTAATAFALTLGLMLVSAIGMLGASAKASIGELVDRGVKADYILAGPPGSFIGVPVAAGAAVKSVAGVQDVVAIRGTSLKVGNDSVGAASHDGPIDAVLNYELRQGSRTLGDDDLLVSQSEADKRGWRVGQRVELASMDNKKIALTVSGVYKDTQLLGNLVIPQAVYERVTPVALRTDLVVLVTAKPGTDLGALRTNLEKATEQFAIVQVQDHEQFKGTQGQQINTMLAILYGLLALAVVIAVLGIVNTLALSVVERRREIGMLRAVGMQRPQVRRSIYLESMLIAVFGAVVGVVLGLSLGVGFLRTLRDLGIDQIAVPWSQIALMLVGSGVVGVLAAVWPGVRAARTPPLAAIADL
ncbi:FtsX-like permease family protein [Nocardia sp. CDC159]|uniref:FtsX-like permease family protein n=1 Tax=Nocardia pulmonis TaxID=2951408 RepID=A0A9X2IYL0_9NOCA|nr:MULTISPECIES: FtsX-like permease family protein [Nocardia]MCM6775764.1 FtsX-like permease family protein [Nocardia pulmonis]MCM6788260.1 FtsX-like permease family protein [Nocardia sp. CDC159]